MFCDRPEDAARFVVATSAALAMTKALKYIVSEHRPTIWDRAPEQSFPSGHSSGVTAFALAAVAASRRWWVVPIAAVAIAAVNISRVRRREHWLHDVMVGDLVGVGGLLLGSAAAWSVARNRQRKDQRVQVGRCFTR
jgi:membrane-associated phospholipid phosphatase